MNSARVHPEDSPDGYLPVGQVILPLAPVIRALVQYRAALQRRSLHHARDFETGVVHSIFENDLQNVFPYLCFWRQFCGLATLVQAG